jgi:hypothetical protein
MKAITTLFFAVATVAVAAQPVSGTWRNSSLTLVLQISGVNLTGSVKDGAAATHTIKAGAVGGDAVRFTTDAVLNGKNVVLEWEGTVKGDELTLMRWVSGNPRNKPYAPFNGPFTLRHLN